MAHLGYYRGDRASVRAYLREKWGWILFAGIILIILGAISLGATFLTTVYSIIALGVVIAIGGVVQLIESIQTRRWNGFFLHLLTGLLYLAIAALFIFHPAFIGVSLTLFIAFFFFASGLFRMITSLAMRFARWGWTFLSGLITLLLGVLIFNSWPSSSLWVIGIFVGIDLFLYGLSMVMFAIDAKTNRRGRYY